MNKISENFKTWYRKYDDSERCKQIKNKAIIVNNSHKKLLIHSNNEFLHTGYRTGIRGGKTTTLSANTTKANDLYMKHLDELKYMVANI